jgi:hypothetical protein
MSIYSLVTFVLAFLLQLFGCCFSNNKVIRGFIALLNMLNSKCGYFKMNKKNLMCFLLFSIFDSWNSFYVYTNCRFEIY